MGVTIFDLFGEILSPDDLAAFTESHGINEHYSGQVESLK